MDQAIITTVDKYVSRLQLIYNDVVKVYLFGSFANGNNSEDSDLDLAIVFANLNDEDRFNRQVELMLIASEIDSKIEPHPFSFDKFNSDSQFAEVIKKSGIEYYPAKNG